MNTCKRTACSVFALKVTGGIMYLKKITLLACLCAVSACGGSSSTTAASTGAPPPPLVIGPTATSSGLVAAGDTVRMDLNFKSYGEVSDTAGAVSFATGFDPFSTTGSAIAASAIEEVRVGAVGSGNGTFTGDYQFSYIDSIVVTSTDISGFQGQEQGTVTLSVDFATGDIFGSGGNSANTSAIFVDGNVSGQSISGSVDVNYADGSFVNRVTTSLGGVVGADGVVGAFYGNTEDTVVSGGFVAQ